MSFFRRKPEEKPYKPEEIKQAIERVTMCAKHQKPIDECAPLHVQLPPMQQPMIQQPVQQMYLPSREELQIPDTAPLFVKVEKYKEIVASISEIKRFIAGTKQLFLVMNEIQGIQQDTVNILRTSIQRMEKSVEWVDQSLLRPAGFEELSHGEIEAKQIETSLADLQREIANLRKDLERMK